MCMVGDGSWHTCAPRPEGEASRLQGTAPLSGLCWTGNADSALGRVWDPCEEGLTCAGLRMDVGSVNGLLSEVLQDMDLPKLSNLSEAGTIGLCAPLPANVDWLPPLESAGEPPLAFFPLSGTTVTSWPAGEFIGTSNGVDVVRDPAMGSVIRCHQSEQDHVLIENIPYGKSGAWTISLWIKATNSSGEDFQYIFSHSADEIMQWTPNQVQLYIPERSHAAFGVVRAIVKDSQDVNLGYFSETYLDSDGEISNNSPRQLPKDHTNVLDGSWHMLTLSTLPSGERGFRMYVDGNLSGELSTLAAERRGMDIDGGRPLLPDSEIILCGRVDLQKDRHFEGEIAQLSLYARALEEAEVASLYSRVAQRMQQIELDAKPNPEDMSKSPTTTSATPCDLDGSQNADSSVARGQCDEGQVCVAASDGNRTTTDGFSDPDRNKTIHGVCKDIPDGLQRLFDGSAEPDFPLPVAWFGMDGGLLSWPAEEKYSLRLGGDSEFVDDDAMGTVLQCGTTNRGQAVLDPVPVGSVNGSLSISLWLRANREANDNAMFHYLLSGEEDTSNVWQWETRMYGTWQPNQVQLFIPAEKHASHGVARALLRDSTDTASENQAFLDSDGIISYNGPRQRSHADLLDGKWHMLSITTLPYGGKGFRLYVDGQLAAELGPGAKSLTAVRATGGNPIHLSGPISICGRRDESPARHFPGRIAGVGFWNKALQPDQVLSLYNAVASKLQGGMAPQTKQLTSKLPPIASVMLLSGSQPRHWYHILAQRMSASGHRCIFPASGYGGDVLSDCSPLPPARPKNVSLAGSGSGNGWCPTEETGSWEPCAPQSFPMEKTTWVEIPMRRTRTEASDACVFPAAIPADIDVVETESQSLFSLQPSFKVALDCVPTQESPVGVCSTTDGSWEECVPEGSMASPSEEADPEPMESPTSSSPLVSFSVPGETIEPREGRSSLRGEQEDAKALLQIREAILGSAIGSKVVGRPETEEAALSLPCRDGQEPGWADIVCDSDSRVASLSLRFVAHRPRTRHSPPISMARFPVLDSLDTAVPSGTGIGVSSSCQSRSTTSLRCAG
uniref:Laminin G domain-containing protein n=1 Tax=Tetraselmis sp. GSL018 TaxID=582737 RepID=A0A061S6Z7_9CHLO